MKNDYRRDLFTELCKDLPKLGPGSTESTRKVFNLLKLPSRPTILDVGCGTGRTTIELAKISNGKIIALDINQVFLDILKNNAEAANVADKIQTINRDMHSMGFEENSFEVIWSENSLFSLGFERALKEWRNLLKKRGYLVVSDLVMLKDDPPDDAKKYWELVYPGLKTHDENLKIVKNQDYKLISSFVFPDTYYNCYDLLEQKIAAFREKYRENKQYMKELDLNQKEIDLFRKYGTKYHGCIFYIMQK